MIASLSMRLRGLSKLPGVVRYGIAALAIVAIVLVIRALPPTIGDTPYILFVPAILLVAILFDHGSSIFATLLAALLSLLFLIEPDGPRAIADPRYLLPLLIFVGTGLGTAAVVEAMRHAVEDLSKANVALVHAHEAARTQSALLATYIESTPDLISVKDRDGRFVHLNSASARLLGAPIETIVGKLDSDFLDAAEAVAIKAADATVIASGQARSIEEQVTGPDGRRRVYLSTKSPWRGDDGKVLGLIVVSRDIDERKAAESLLQQANTQKQLLLYDMNHRIKNHLQTVVGPMSVAARKVDSLEAARGALTDAVGRLTVLGRVYTRLQLGDDEAVVDARSFLGELCGDLSASLAGERPVVIHCDAGAVTVDATRAVTLGLVVNELVQNALKYAFPDDRAGSVTVAFHRDGEHYLLRVADDGVGTHPDGPSVGTGAGQRLLRAMAAQLGGTLAAAGPPGTVWTLRFPVA